jgi:hypothetical protein
LRIALQQGWPLQQERSRSDCLFSNRTRIHWDQPVPSVMQYYKYQMNGHASVSLPNSTIVFPRITLSVITDKTLFASVLNDGLISVAYSQRFDGIGFNLYCVQIWPGLV